MLHSTLAFNAEGTPLGLLDVQCWARDAAQFGKRHRRKQLPIEEKESVKWLKSFRQVAEVQRRTRRDAAGQRGGSGSGYLRTVPGGLGQDRTRPWLLVRAERDRLRAEGQEHLWPWVAQQAVAGMQEVQVPRRGAQAARVARLEVRFAQSPCALPTSKDALAAS